jgi:hypothetical protein
MVEMDQKFVREDKTYKENHHNLVVVVPFRTVEEDHKGDCLNGSTHNLVEERQEEDKQRVDLRGVELVVETYNVTMRKMDF